MDFEKEAIAPNEDLVKLMAIAVRRQKFQRTGRGKQFDPTNITENELDEIRYALNEAIANGYKIERMV